MKTKAQATGLPLVSIIMPAYNAARYLKSAVNSVRSQCYQNWELLIVDDASLDDTRKIAENLSRKDERIRLYTKKKNGGIAEARNEALKNADGKYIAFLDSDDIWRSNKLSKQIKFMEKSGILICYSAYRRVDEHYSDLGTVHPRKEVTYNDMLRSNHIGNLTGVYNAEVLKKQYFLNFGHEDYTAWLALVKTAGKAFGLNEVLADYRVYTASTSSNKLRTVSWQWKIYRGNQQLGVFFSSWLMLCYGYHALFKRSTRYFRILGFIPANWIFQIYRRP